MTKPPISTIDALPRPLKHIDDSAVTWRAFPGYDGLFFWVLGANEARQQIDLYFRLAPGARCPSHRHVGPTDTLVVEGEHITWALDDDGNWHLDEQRQPATFAANEGDHLHSEEGGSEGAIIKLSMTAVDGIIWETFDEDNQLVDTATFADFSRALEKQRTTR